MYTITCWLPIVFNTVTLKPRQLQITRQGVLVLKENMYASSPTKSTHVGKCRKTKKIKHKLMSQVENKEV